MRGRLGFSVDLREAIAAIVEGLERDIDLCNGILALTACRNNLANVVSDFST
jgi:hypothetical protein